MAGRPSTLPSGDVTSGGTGRRLLAESLTETVSPASHVLRSPNGDTEHGDEDEKCQDPNRNHDLSREDEPQPRQKPSNQLAEQSDRDGTVVPTVILVLVTGHPDEKQQGGYRSNQPRRPFRLSREPGPAGHHHDRQCHQTERPSGIVLVSDPVPEGTDDDDGNDGRPERVERDGVHQFSPS